MQMCCGAKGYGHLKGCPYKKKKEIIFPKFICENCGHAFKLYFDPKKEPAHLLIIRCEKCLELASWEHYWKPWELDNQLEFILWSRLREMIKTQQLTLLEARL